MDIAAVSMNIASANQGSAISLSLMKKAMLQRATVPSPAHLGNVVDTYA